MHLLLRLLHASQGLSLLVQPFMGSLPWPPGAGFVSICHVSLGGQHPRVLPGREVRVDDIGLAEVHSCCMSEKRNHVEIGELRRPLSLSRILAVGPEKVALWLLLFTLRARNGRGTNQNFPRIKIMKCWNSRF